MKMILFYTACSFLLVVPVLFVWNRVYKDGIFGRISLLGISSVAGLFLLDSVDEHGGVYEPTWLTVWGFVSFAVFLVWHLCRFHHRVIVHEKSRGNASMYLVPNNDRRHTNRRRFIQRR
jgi:uncharacterized PurR-regulated membrane protein YhhQ (DUF165 family)